jgi:hypothetical protein
MVEIPDGVRDLLERPIYANLATVHPDPEGKMYQRLSERYEGRPTTPKDAADRVAIAVKPTWVHGQ